MLINFALNKVGTRASIALLDQRILLDFEASEVALQTRGCSVQGPWASNHEVLKDGLSAFQR